MEYNKQQLWNEVSKQPELKSWLGENKLPKEVLEKHLLTFCSYQQKIEKCRNCIGLNNCRQAMIGKQPFLEYNGCLIVMQYQPCMFEQHRQQTVKDTQYLQWISCYPPKEDLQNIYVNDERRGALQQMKRLLSDYEKHLPTKGIYLFGPYGCGKSYLMMYLASKLADMKAKVIFAYYPDLVRRLKSSIGTGELENGIDMLKDIEVLILDDFGGEMPSNFIRDEVLGTVLQERMVHKKLTLMTSNLDAKSLREHLAEGNKDTDQLRASRIYERIYTLMDFIELKDKNYR